MMSPFGIPPLALIGRWMTRKVHGNRRSIDGYLLIGKYYADKEQEWRLGVRRCRLVICLWLPQFNLGAVRIKDPGEPAARAGVVALQDRDAFCLQARDECV
jgi:hypothetical protein